MSSMLALLTLSLAALSRRVRRLSSRQAISRCTSRLRRCSKPSAAAALLVALSLSATTLPSRRSVFSWSRVWAGITGSPSVVVIRATHVLVQRQRGLGRLGPQRLAVRAAGQDRIDAAVGRRVNGHRPRARGFQAFVPVLARQALQAQAAAVALPRVRAVVHLPANERGAAHADALAPGNELGRCPVQMGA